MLIKTLLKKAMAKYRRPHFFDGVVGDFLGGWCQGADRVDFLIQGQRWATCPCDVNRPDLGHLMENTQCGFTYPLDAATLPVDCLFKREFTVELLFYQADTLLVRSQQQVNPQTWVEGAKLYYGVSVHELVKHITASQLWDEPFYLKQVQPHETQHPNAIIDFLIKANALGKLPSRHFNTPYYLAINQDVARSHFNPLVHYLAFGEEQGRRPMPYFSPNISSTLPNRDEVEAHHTQTTTQFEAWLADSKSLPLLEDESWHRAQSVVSREQYRQWINGEMMTKHQAQAQLRQMPLHPLISIVVPVYNPDKVLLERCIESVLEQSYPHWQLCLADDASTKPHVREVLEYYQHLDSRIQVIFRDDNGHISAASNSALALARGEWTALLDHDDELSPHALFHVVSTINQQPDVDFIYTDEDKIDETGQYSAPHYKSDWNLDLLYSQNYVSHLGIYKTEIVKRIGGFRQGYEGSQDYDLLLRYSREIDHTNIVHIPKVLYHWRVTAGSTASGAEAKSYTTQAGIKALQDHFEQLGEQVSVERGKQDNIYKVNWPIADANPLVSLLIPTYNGYQITKQAIDSILEKTTYRHFEILLIDNNSDDAAALAYFEHINQHEQVRVLRYPHPFNYSAINNFAAKQAKGDILGLINNDIEVINPEWLTEMVSHAQRSDIGCVGAMLYYPNDTIQHAGVILGINGVAGHSHKHFPRESNGYFSRLHLVQNLSAVTAACLLVRKSVFEQVGGLNETDLKVAFNDVDFCLKVKQAGYRNLWTPYAELYHHESISRGAEDNPEKIARFNKEVEYMKTTWATDTTPDPFYNANLTQIKEDFTIAV
ncbi:MULTISPECIES: glycosyltransferase family 2 protein [unclassified Vibrio]|uniref:Glycosyltransferase family 2 protein n=1 Tax=Vibrio sp. HB236076 TaxID=3232307 RepID=A0AB39HEM0_9VIBR|nr:glycosyltransferase family 2 protein [Vibrio sp. HB161653]MDP5254348.1 glycosyltransferase family 2 protein [Vibrio sp. HB161653]